VLIAAWVALALIRIAYSGRGRGSSTSLYASHMVAASIPVVLSLGWLWAGPMKAAGSVTLVACASLLPPACDTLWAWAGDRTGDWGWWDAVILPAISIGVALTAFEVAGATVLSSNVFGDSVATNSPDRSYWYVVRKADSSGAERASTYGFIGPQPAPTYVGLRVLVIGDSIPDASREVNFPKVAAALFAEREEGPVEIVNAAIAAYSLEQMKRFYAERLSTLRHDILVITFYLDDINRELRYRKRNQLYTPSWPEWMQDVYYRCFVCRTLLTAAGFTENTFLLYRTRGREESVPAALKTLDQIRAYAGERGAVVALLNVPIFDWPDVLATSQSYRFNGINQVVEAWVRDRGVYYRDLLPALVGRDIRGLRRGDRNIHFNEQGHRLVGAELKALVDTVIAHEGMTTRLK
jgi:lysophospholipase L1-like esterase